MIDLITGHQGIPHISAEQISTLHRSLMGTSGDNTVIKMTGGNLTQAGLAVEISAGFWRVHGYDMEIQEGETVLFDPTESGYSRIDNVYVEVLQDISSGVQRAELVNVMGEPSTTTPTAPSAPTEPENSYDILVVAVPVLTATITEGAMTFTDLTTQYDVVTQEDIEDVQTLAEEAQSSASNAQSIASSAQTTANAASTNANNALNMIRRPTDDYSEFKSYSVGDYCIYNNRVYKCITACSAGSWTTNQNCFEWVSLTSAVTALNSALTWKHLVSHAMNDGYAPARDLPSDFREMLFVYHYGTAVCSAILNKQAFISAGNTTNQHQTGWYATSTNAGGFYITYNNSKFSLYDFYYQSASHHDATCDVYYR